MRAKVVEVSRASNPKRELLRLVGDLKSFVVLNDLVLLAAYIEPEKTSGGVYLAQKTLDESKWQGKVGLVLKKGPTAFKYAGESGFAYEGAIPNDGDWVVHRVSDGFDLLVQRVYCRLIQSSSIKGIIPEPDYVY